MIQPIEMQKVTVELPKDLLASAKAALGKGNTETIREALKSLVAYRAQLDLLALRGTLKKGDFSIEEMRSWEDD